MPGTPEAGGQALNLIAQSISFEMIPEGSLIRDLERYWRELPSNNGLPSRNSILPEEIPRRLLPWILLLEVEGVGPERLFRYRLAGTANVELVGRNVTGKEVSEAADPGGNAGIEASYRECADTKAPIFWRATLQHEKTYPVLVYRGIFPLSSDGETVDHILAAAIPAKEDWRR